MAHPTSTDPPSWASDFASLPGSDPAANARWLRAEIAATEDALRRARLLTELAELEERAGEDNAAAREYLAAYEAEPTFREPLEGLARLFERRAGLKGLGELFEAFVEAAAAPDERVRALFLRAQYEADGRNDLEAAMATVQDAAAAPGSSTTEKAVAWLMLEMFAGRAGERGARERALERRSEQPGDPTWRMLLALDLARLRVEDGGYLEAIRILEHIRGVPSEARWEAACLLDRLLRRPGAFGDVDETARLGAQAAAWEDVAELVVHALDDDSGGDTLGVPTWGRDPARAIDAWLRAAENRRALGQRESAAVLLERATGRLDRMAADHRKLAESAILQACMRQAEQAGDLAMAASLANLRLPDEKDAGVAAALALRIAQHAAGIGDAKAAIAALGRAIECDPACLPARALRLDALADGEPAALAEELEDLAEHLATDEGRARAYLLAAFVWAARAHDIPAAKATLNRAAELGTPPEAAWRTGRLLASMADDSAWYEDATRRLLESGAAGDDAVGLLIELARAREARGDSAGAQSALYELKEAPGGAFLGRVLAAFSRPNAAAAPPPDVDGADASREALGELVARESDAGWSATLGTIAALRAHAAGDLASAREHLARVARRTPDDVMVVAYALDLDRASGHVGEAARRASDFADRTVDGELAAALHLESAFELYRAGEVLASLRECEAVALHAPEAAALVSTWASWALEPDDPTRRREVISAAALVRDDVRALAIEKFATELALGDVSAAATALDDADESRADSLGLAAALGRVVLPARPSDAADVERALARVGQEGPRAALFAAAERARLARDIVDPAGHLEAARSWFEAGGGAAAALEWLAAAIRAADPREQMQARVSLALSLPPEPRDAMLASAATLQPRVEVDRPHLLLSGKSPALLLANLELAPPGCDPRRRASVLEDLDDTLGDDSALDALSLAAWARLLASDFGGAAAAFQRVVSRRPYEIAAWEGLRHGAERSGEHAVRAEAAARLGALCASPQRGAAFWEEAALVWLELGVEDRGDQALEASFARDPTRPVGFDRLFRRVRERKDYPKLLELIARRLEVSDDPNEIQRLYWEQARSLRESGDHDGALRALEHVTLLDANHVGALALLGEINLRRGKFDEAALALSRLAALENAPARNRATAGIAAVDIYENKLGLHDRALDVLLGLHRAGLATLPVRERLARAAARTGSWVDATEILEALMSERPDSAGRAEAARFAMAIRRDRLGDPLGSANAVARLLTELPTDPEGIDMLERVQMPPDVENRLLESAQTGLVNALRDAPTDASAVKRLAFVARRRADPGLEQAALGVLASLGASDVDAEQAFAQLSAHKQRLPQTALPPEGLRALLSPGDAGPLAELFAVLGPTLAEALGPSLQACGVTRRDRVDPRSGLALRNEIASWAGALGIGEFDLYVGGKDPLGIQGVSGDPHALVVGAGVNAPLAPLARARVARELFAVARGVTTVRWRDDVTIAAIVVSACRLVDVRLEHPPYAVLAEVERLLGRAISRRTRKLLPELCRAIIGAGADARAWSKRALASLDRMATIASGDPAVVLSDVLGVPIDRLGTAVPGQPRAEDLLRFVLSPSYLDVRRSLGLESAQ